MIAVCDHNTSGNVNAVREAALLADSGVTVIPGLEITSVEEVHVLGLFPTAEAALHVSSQIKDVLPLTDRDYFDHFGHQPLLDAAGYQTGEETACLAAATPFSVEETVELIHKAGGLAVAAHVDRRAFGVFSQLGFFPRHAGFDAVEVSRHLKAESSLWALLAELDLPLVTSSDAHFLEEVGCSVTEIELSQPSFAELRLALSRQEGRRVLALSGKGRADHA